MKKLLSFILIGVLISSNALAFKIITTGGKEVRWKKNEIKYKINKVGSDDFQGGSDSSGASKSEFSIIDASFKEWTDVAGTDFRVINDGYSDKTDTGMDDENTILWVEQGWMSLDFRPPAGALAVTISSYNLSNGEMVDSDIHFNGQYFNWSHIDTDSEVNDMDLQSIATHEIGHFFGVDHSSEEPMETSSLLREATMYYAAVPGDTHARKLNADDIQGIQHLYPSDDNIVDPTIYDISPNSVRNSNSSVEIEITGANFAKNAAIVFTLGKDEYGDIECREPQISSSGKTIKCTADFANAYPGTYHLKVSNAYKKDDYEKDMIEVAAVSGYTPAQDKDMYSSSNVSGCGMINSENPGPSSLLFLLILVLAGARILSRKTLPVRVQSRRERRKA